jgi:ABC-type transport system involved in cytochrome c biogenesis permease subunit
MHSNRQSGFITYEYLPILAIVGILAALTLPIIIRWLKPTHPTIAAILVIAIVVALAIVGILCVIEQAQMHGKSIYIVVAVISCFVCYLVFRARSEAANHQDEQAPRTHEKPISPTP